MNSVTSYWSGCLYISRYTTDYLLCICKYHFIESYAKLTQCFQTAGMSVFLSQLSSGEKLTESSRCSLFGLIMPNTYILSLLTSLNIRRGWKFSHEEDCSTGPTSMRLTEPNLKGQTRSTFTHKVLIIFFLLFLPSDVWLGVFQPDIIPLGDLTFVCTPYVYRSWCYWLIKPAGRCRVWRGREEDKSDTGL